LPASLPEERRYEYFLTPKGTAEKAAMTKVFLKRKIQGYDGLKAEIEALGANRVTKWCRKTLCAADFH